MGYTLGIDFGTTNTRVAIRRDDERPRALDIRSGPGTQGFVMPSSVSYRRGPNGVPVVDRVGEAAEASVALRDRIVIREVKRAFVLADFPGTSGWADYWNKRLAENHSWWDPVRRTITLWGHPIDPAEVAAAILEEAIRRAQAAFRAQLGFLGRMQRLRIAGLPLRMGTWATAGRTARLQLQELVHRLGFDGFELSDIVEEPVLACLGYIRLQDAHPGEKILVLDLGGGTLDVAIVEVEADSKFTVLGADGEAFLGGLDIDRSLGRHLTNRIAREVFGFHTVTDIEKFRDTLDPWQREQISSAARRLKETFIPGEKNQFILSDFSGHARISLPVTEVELNQAIESSEVIEKSLACALRAFQWSQMVEWNGLDQLIQGTRLQSVLRLGHSDLSKHIDRVLLVGGATRLKGFRDAVAKQWGGGKLLSPAAIDPLTAAAIGASMHHPTSLSVVVDRLPFDLVVQSGGAEKVVYQAYERIAEPITGTLAVNPVDFPINISLAQPGKLHFKKPSGVNFKKPSGVTVDSASLEPVHYFRKSLRIDFLGRILIFGGDPPSPQQEIHSPSQNPTQRRTIKKLDELEELKRKIKGDRLKKVPGYPWK